VKAFQEPAGPALLLNGADVDIVCLVYIHMCGGLLLHLLPDPGVQRRWRPTTLGVRKQGSCSHLACQL
jgi:hypothetical protein